MTVSIQRNVNIDVDKATVIGERTFVKLSATAKAVAAGDGEDAIGVAVEGTDATKDAAIAVNVRGGGGKQEVWCGAAIALVAGGTEIASDADGKAVAAAAGDVVLGYALNATAAADEIVTILMIQGAYRKA